MGRSVSTPSNAVSTVFGYMSTDEYDYDHSDWTYLIESIQDSLKKKFKSMDNVSSWIGREDHVILENNLAQVTISEYCGCVAVCLVSREDDNGYHPYREYLSEAWCARVTASFDKIVNECLPNPMRSVGRASNGEQFFVPVGKRESVVTSKEGVLW